MDPDSPVPFYEQIADIIKGRIESGRYAPGTLVPSIERIRQETGCAVMTIRKGLRLLADNGWVQIVPGKGTYVCPPEMWREDR